MRKQLLIDTNIIIRFLTNDHPEHSPKALELIKLAVEGKVTLYLDQLVVAESVWVLSKVYSFPRDVISDKLSQLVEFEGIHSPDKNVILLALDMFARHNVDYADALLAARAETLGDTVVVTFNTKDFNRLGVNNLEPNESMGSTEEDAE
ncbi:PIN domain-containing protein [uncultured Brevibacillus sp.]|uniref:PIN domain-containing protein n=1 Tax=uncultured Brevibacillus sp. TaxID=169970 RepID=UPI002592535E|nr:type II toxin-antitoxin system VapC family toxin [uncultured Brevibacillus sp.]